MAQSRKTQNPWRGLGLGSQNGEGAVGRVEQPVLGQGGLACRGRAHHGQQNRVKVEVFLYREVESRQSEEMHLGDGSLNMGCCSLRGLRRVFT